MNQDGTIDREAAAPRGRAWRRAAIVVSAIGILAVLGLWLVRDLPRRWVQARLAAMLDAQVTLDALEIDGLGHFVLRGLDVHEISWEPRLERISIERVDVEAPFRDALNGRYDRLTIDGVTVRITPPARPGTPAPDSTVQARTIEIHRGRLIAASGADETEGEFTARLTDWGSTPGGQVSFAAEQFDSTPLAAILGWPAMQSGGAGATAEALRLDAHLQGGSEPLRVEAEAGRLRLRYAERTVELSRPRLQATGARDAATDTLHVSLRADVPGIEAAVLDAELDGASHALRSGHARLQGVDVATLLGSATVEGRADLLLRTDDGQSLAYEVDALLHRLELPLAAGTLRGEQIQATVNGTWNAAADAETGEPQPLGFVIEATLGSLRIAVDATEFVATRSRITARGEIDSSGHGELRTRVTLPGGRGVHADHPWPEELFPIGLSLDGRFAVAESPAFEGTAEVVSPVLGNLRTRGRTIVAESRPIADWRWDWTAAPDLPDLRASAAELGVEFLPSYVLVVGRPGARGTLTGALTDPVVQGQLRIEALEVSPATGSWNFDQAVARASFSRHAGDDGHVVFGPLAVEGRWHQSSDRVAGEWWSRPLTVSATGRVDPGTAALQRADARIDVEGFGGVQITGRVETDRSVALTARLEPLDLGEIRELSRLWLEDPAPDYSLQGSVVSRLDLRRTSAGEWHGSGEIDLIEAGFASRDSTRVLQGAETHWTFDLSGRTATGFAGSATAAVTGPVMLWGTLFADFSPLASEVRVEAHGGGDRWEATADWSLPHGATIRGRVGTAPDLIDYGVGVELTDLSAFLDHYIRVPFEGSVENLDTLGAAGELRVDLTGTVDDTRHAIEGSAEVTDASFTGIEGKTGVDGLQLSLPISLSWNRNAEGSDRLLPGPERTGSVAYEELRLAGLEFPALATPLTVASDTIRLERPLNLALLDGRVELRQVALARWSRADGELGFGLRLDELSLAALTRALGSFPLDGTLSGTFPAVHLTPDRLQVDGGGTMDVFGGSVEVFDISGEDVLSRFPRLQFSARFDGIHLLDVTRTIDFGEVYGVVGGEITDCELFGGVPVRCQASLASVKTRGVPQKISVKAIRNISILGAGPRVGFLDRGLQKFFDTYNYSRLGFTMKLERDRFLLRGTERRGERELFVKGRMPFRIDIVNAAPKQTVSFQTMMSRLRNLKVVEPQRLR